MELVTFFRREIPLFKQAYNDMHDKGDCNVGKLPCAIDVVASILRYGAIASDYFDYEFYKKTSFERKRFACWYERRKLHRIFNGRCNAGHVFDNKAEFLHRFEKYIGRDSLYTPESTEEEIKKFAEKHSTFIAKPCNSSCGNGVRKITYTPKKMMTSSGSLKIAIICLKN